MKDKRERIEDRLDNLALSISDIAAKLNYPQYRYCLMLNNVYDENNYIKQSIKHCPSMHIILESGEYIMFDANMVILVGDYITNESSFKIKVSRRQVDFKRNCINLYPIYEFNSNS